MPSHVPATPSLPRLAILLCLGLTPLIAGGEDTRRPYPAPPADLAPPTAPAERTARNDLDQLRQALEQDALMLDQARRQLQWLQLNLQELARTLGWLQQRHQWHREMGQRLDRHLATETTAAPSGNPQAGAEKLQQQLRAQDRELQRLRSELEQLRQQERPKQAASASTRISADSEPSDDRDRDADGVADAGDLCPDTAATAITNRLGCTAGRPMVLSDVRFEYDASRFTPESVPALERIARILQRHPGVRLEIAGHTDAKGDPAYNQWLSRQRAAAVRDFLVDRGVEGNRLNVRGYGPEQPIGDNSTWIGIQKNRRVELRLLEATAQAAPTATRQP